MTRKPSHHTRRGAIVTAALAASWLAFLGASQAPVFAQSGGVPAAGWEILRQRGMQPGSHPLVPPRDQPKSSEEQGKQEPEVDPAEDEQPTAHTAEGLEGSYGDWEADRAASGVPRGEKSQGVPTGFEDEQHALRGGPVEAEAPRSRGSVVERLVESGLDAESVERVRKGDVDEELILRLRDEGASKEIIEDLRSEAMGSTGPGVPLPATAPSAE